ncbi:MAG: sulfite oxidase-like oxidoreductase [Rhodospirillales bacterium]|nr:sulfite oxidase-like oxidoreductase [Rhodospirillales bacterium]
MTDDDPTPSNPKLVAAKQAWARAGRLLTGTHADPARDRLPPGQTLTQDWPVLDLGEQPNVTEAKFRLDIDGAVAHPLSLTLAQFLALPQAESISDIHCVTQWSRYDNRWTGVPASALIAAVAPKDEARFVIFHAHDGYTTNISRADFERADAIVAHAWSGAPLTRAHGGPVRAVIPSLYFWKSAKWLRRIEFALTDRPGFWERRGYHNHGDPWAEERYS